MAYVALYRRWRPSDFDALVGQETVKQALTNALEQGHIAHAYLFAGPRGTGKTSTARILAKALNCDEGPAVHPCGKCKNCLSIADGSSLDVLEIDAASNRGIDNIKELRDRIAFAPVDGRYKVYVIDEVHMLTTEAFNALLKTLEEPPENVVFILATTDPHKVPATIHSRCQRFDFRRVTVDDITKHLMQVAKASDIVADEDALRLIAIQADGGMRDALSLLDQCAVLSPRVTADSVKQTLGLVGREALRDLALALGRQEAAEAIAQTQKLLQQGRDPARVLTELTEYLRAVMLFKSVPSYEEIYLTDAKENLQQVGEVFTLNRILAALEQLTLSLNNVRFAMKPKITLELTLIGLCYNSGETLAALAARVEALESGYRVQSTASSQQPTANSQQGSANRVENNAEFGVRNAERKVVKETGVSGQPTGFSQQSSASRVQPTAISQQGLANRVENNAEFGVRSAEREVSKGDRVQPAVQTAAAPERVRRQFPVQQEKMAGQAVAVSADGQKFWQEAIDYLSQQGKRAMASCARSGRVVALKDNKLTVLFPGNQFAAQRMGMPDYKKAFEDTILTMQRVPVTCEFVWEYKEELPGSVQKALDAFGGTAVQVSD